MGCRRLLPGLRRSGRATPRPAAVGPTHRQHACDAPPVRLRHAHRDPGRLLPAGHGPPRGTLTLTAPRPVTGARTRAGPASRCAPAARAGRAPAGAPAAPAYRCAGSFAPAPLPTARYSGFSLPHDTADPRDLAARRRWFAAGPGYFPARRAWTPP